jgi:hypothetical protein
MTERERIDRETLIKRAALAAGAIYVTPLLTSASGAELDDDWAKCPNANKSCAKFEDCQSDRKDSDQWDYSQVCECDANYCKSKEIVCADVSCHGMQNANTFCTKIGCDTCDSNTGKCVSKKCSNSIYACTGQRCTSDGRCKCAGGPTCKCVKKAGKKVGRCRPTK